MKHSLINLVPLKKVTQSTSKNKWASTANENVILLRKLISVFVIECFVMPTNDDVII